MPLRRLKIPMSTEVRLLLICTALSLGGFLFGYNLVVMGGVILMPNFTEKLEITQTLDVYIAIITTMMAAAFVGAILSGPLADILGRRGLAIICTMITVVGDFLLVAANNLSMVYAGRAITGFSIGMLSMTLPLYLTEIAPPFLRGRAIAIHQFCIILGISIAFWVTYASTNFLRSRSWRLPLGIQLIPTLIFGLFLVFIPQSPRYLVQRHRDQEALESLALIRGDGTTAHSTVQMEFTEIKQTIMFEEKHKRNGYMYLFRHGEDRNFQRLLVGILAQAFQQLTGANALMLYAPIIFHRTDVNGHVPALFANAISGLVMVVATIPAVVWIDRWSRRKTMILGALGCCVCMIAMATVAGVNNYHASALEPIYYIQEQGELNTSVRINNPSASSVIFFVMFYLFLGIYGCTWGPMGWIYPAELYTQGVRSKALGITTASNWFFTFGVVQLAPLAFHSIQWRIYVIYCILCLAIAVIVYAFFPETQGKSLEEIDLLFSGNFKTDDPNVHHPQTASEALDLLEQKNSQYTTLFAFTDTAGFVDQ